MTMDDHLMVIAMEECVEVAHRISKAIRFGMEQIQQDADDKPEENPNRLTNRQRIAEEYYQLRAVMGMIGIDAWSTSERARSIEARKVRNITTYMERSRANGRL